jgi:recombination protein RecA
VNADKSARLDAALAAIQHKWGVSLVRHLNEIATRQGIASGYIDLDSALPAGVPYGAVTELMGKPTSGMTTLALSILRQAQGGTGYILYVDLDSTFDPRYAALCGIDLERLFLARPETNFEALDIAHDVLASGSHVAIALDLGSHLPEARLLRRVRAALAKSGCIALFLIPHYDASHLVTDRPAALRLLIERVHWLRRGQDVTGLRSKVTILKSQHAQTVRHVEIDIWLETEALHS